MISRAPRRSLYATSIGGSTNSRVAETCPIPPICFEPASWPAVKYYSGLWIFDFGDEGCTLAPDYAESSLPGFDPM